MHLMYVSTSIAFSNACSTKLTSDSKLFASCQTFQPPLAFFGLANRATNLSSELDALKQFCGHTSAAVGSVTREIALLAATLSRLHEAIGEDATRYTESFYHDLAEITSELVIVFEEISECCKEIQKADPISGNAISWLFKKSKVHHLQKHMDALKTTLIVMRTVLNHGKEYGKQR